MSLGAKIRELRIKNNLSLQDVADNTGISKAHVWDMERGNSSNPSIELVAKLADVFKVSVSYLVGEAFDSNDEKGEMVAMYRGLKDLDPHEREAVQGLIDVYLKRKKEGK